MSAYSPTRPGILPAQGIEALIAGEIGVRSLQEHARDLAEQRAQASGQRGATG